VRSDRGSDNPTGGRRLLRRWWRRRGPERPLPDNALLFADVVLDPDTRVVERDGRPIELTPTEFNLLELFLRNPGKVLTRTFISEEVWGFDFGGNSNSLNVYVGYLRRKMEADGEPRLIATIRGVGYVLQEPRASPEMRQAADS
jgi:two-component system, OmpR family, response regulator MprA